MRNEEARASVSAHRRWTAQWGSRPKTAVNAWWLLSERRRRFPQVLADDEGGLRKAPDNRHEDGDARAYVKDLASRGGPGSCVGVPRGRSKALIGVHAGRLLSLENSSVQGADA